MLNIISRFNVFSDLKSFSRSLEHFFLTVGRNNLSNKIPSLTVEDYGNVSKLGKTRQRFLTEAASKSSCLILASNRKCYISVSHNFLVFA